VDEGHPTQLAYAVEGELRNANSEELDDVLVTLIDEHGNERAAATRAVGAFRFFPVAVGHHRVTGTKPSFRANATYVAVPNDRPVTLVRLREPTESMATTLRLPYSRSNQ
jgi:hypothetical protein